MRGRIRQHTQHCQGIQAHRQIQESKVSIPSLSVLSGRPMLTKEEMRLCKSFLNSFGTFDRLCTPAGLCEFGDINDNETADLFNRQLHSVVDIELGRGLISPHIRPAIESYHTISGWFETYSVDQTRS